MAAHRPPSSTTAAQAKARAKKALAPRLDAAQRVQELERRLDRWVNYATGLGTVEDKTRQAHFEFPWRLNDQEVTALVSGNDLAAKIVEKRPNEMFRRGYTLEARKSGGSGGGAGGSSSAGADKSQIEDLMAYAVLRKTNVRLLQGMKFGRQYGGSLLLLGVDDGRPPDQPVDEANIRSVSYINQIDRRFAYVQSYYADFTQPNFGEPETYLVASGVATSAYRSNDGTSFGIRRNAPGTILQRKPAASIATIHESRLLRFDGVETDILTQQSLAGWSWSILQRVYEVLRLCDGSFDALGYLLADASQGVFKLKGLFNAITAGQEGRLSGRLEQIEQTRSAMHAIALDAGGDEDFTRVTTPLTGIPDSIDRIMQRLAAAADMPVEELFGLAPGGLASAGAGESSRIHWYDTIANEQQNDLAPKLERLYRLFALAKDSPFRGKDVAFKVAFHPLYAPTDSELAKTRLANAQRDVAYVQAEVVTPEQVQLTLADIYPSIDPEEIEEEIDAKTKFDPYANDPNASDEAAAKKAKDEATARAKAKSGAVPGATAAGGGESATTAVPLPGASARPSTTPTTAGGGGGTPSDEGATKSDRFDSADRAALEGLEVLTAARADGGAARAVFRQLLADYPAKALGWVLAAHWTGPVEVPLDQIDSSGRASWRASHDGHVAKHVERVEAGESDPVILVKPPGDAKNIIVDGHHRFLAHEALGRPVLAYVAEVHVPRGPWDELHSMQKRGSSRSSTEPSVSWTAANRESADGSARPPARGDGGADQERVPAGQPGGGEFASSGGGAGGGGAPRTTGKRTWTDDDGVVG